MGKKKKHEEGHGGAWKVAYADFVTAMMALFMVLWILGQDQEVLESTARYFQDPFKTVEREARGVMPKGSGGAAQVVSSPMPQPNNALVDAVFLKELAEEFYKMLKLDMNDQETPIKIEITSEGLRITLYDREQQAFFVKNTPTFTPWGEFVVQNLAWIMDRYKKAMHLRIDAYTDELSESKEDYTAWELSTDRAHAVRRRLAYYALDASTVERITGFGNPQLMPKNMQDQRIELSLSFTPKDKIF